MPVTILCTPACRAASVGACASTKSVREPRRGTAPLTGVCNRRHLQDQLAQRVVPVGPRPATPCWPSTSTTSNASTTSTATLPPTMCCAAWSRPSGHAGAAGTCCSAPEARSSCSCCRASPWWRRRAWLVPVQPGGVTVHQQAQQHRRVVGIAAATGVLPCQRAQVQLVDDLHHKAREMILGKPLVHRRRQKVRGFSVDS